MQKELELRALSLALKDKTNVVDFLKAGILPETFIINTDVWDFIQGYYSQYGDVPSVDIIKAKYTTFEEKPTNASELQYLAYQLIENEIRRKTVNSIQKAETTLITDTSSTVDQLIQDLIAIRQGRQFSRGYTDQDAISRLDAARERRELIKKKKVIGIPTGIRFLDEKHVGWQPGDLVSLVGRTNIGKTFLLIYIAGVAWKAGYRVLFISPELSKAKMEVRWDTIVGHMFNFNFPLSKLLEGDVDYVKYEQWLQQSSKRGDWLTVESYFGKPFSTASIQAMVSEFRPDIISVDGISLLSGTGDEEWEKVKSIADGLKGIAQNNQKVVIVTSQANKDAQKQNNQMPTLETIAGSYAVAQDSDIILAMGPSYKSIGSGKDKSMVGDPDMRAISLIKMREGVVENSRQDLTFQLEYGNIGVAP